VSFERVTENVFAATTWRGCNPGFVATAEGVVSVDSPQLPTHAVIMRTEMLARGPLRYRVNTEHHIDHIFGNHFFADLGALLIGHEDLAAEFWKPIRGRDPYDYMREVVEAQDREGLAIMPTREQVRIDPPEITFSDRMSVKLGDHVIEIIHTPGHTKAQLAVYIPKEKVIFVGDTIFAECQTWLQVANPEIWLRSLQMLNQLDVEFIVPGHGPIVDKSYFVKQSAFIREWIAAVAAGMAKGWSKKECVARISFLDRYPVDIGQEKSGSMIQQLNVECLYDFLSKQAS
jgi:cyclase